MIDNSPKESVQALKSLREFELENTRIVRENIILKEEVETLRSIVLTKPPISKAHDEFIHLWELYEKLLVVKRHFTCYYVAKDHP